MRPEDGPQGPDEIGKMLKTILIQVLLLFLLFQLVWSLDIWIAISLTYPAYFLLVPLTFGLLCLPVAFFSRWLPVTVIPCLWLMFLIVLPFWGNSSLKTLMWGVGDLEAGMDKETVLQVIGNHYAGSPYGEPLVFGEEHFRDEQGRQVTRWLIKPQGREPELQAESLLVFFQDGQFSRASFVPD